MWATGASSHCRRNLLLFTATGLVAIALAVAETTYMATIDAGSPLKDVPQTMIGIEVEAVGHSLSGGGLSSQMLTDSSFEDPRDDPANSPVPGLVPVCNGTCHWQFGPGASIQTTDAFNGNRSLILQPGARVTSSGLYGRGLALQPGTQYRGYLFAKGGEVAAELSDDCALPRDSSPDGKKDAQTARLKSDDWSMIHLTLAFAGANATNHGCLVLRATGGSPVSIDQVFLEDSDALWGSDGRQGFGPGSGLHLRKDVTDSLLLAHPTTGRPGLQALRLNGGMVNNQNYLWKNHRGAAWLRPASFFNGTAGSWYRHATHEFAMFEALHLAELGGIKLVMLGINVWQESPETAGQLVEYLFGDGSTEYGTLRAADGHAAPFNASAIVVELGNEETDSGYWNVTRPILLAMRAKCASLMQSGAAAGQQNLAALRFSIMFAPWGFNPGNATDKARIARDTAAFSANMMWDQHDGSNKVNWPDIGFQRHDEMLAFLRPLGWTQPRPLIVGEDNCAAPRNVCSSLNRALVYSLQIADAVRSGYTVSVMPAVWAYAACNSSLICGGGDGQTDWPQEQLILTAGGVVAQPSWYAHRQLAHAWGGELLAVAPNRTMSGPANATMLDLTALRDKDGNISVHATYTGTIAATLQLRVRGQVCSGHLASSILSGANVSMYNTQAAPDRIVPSAGAVEVSSTGIATTRLLPSSLSVFTIPTVC